MRLVEEVGGRLAGAADAADLDDAPRVEREVVGDRDDARRDRVVAAALAQRGRPALIVVACQPNEVGALGRGFLDSHVRYISCSRMDRAIHLPVKGRPSHLEIETSRAACSGTSLCRMRRIWPSK